MNHTRLRDPGRPRTDGTLEGWAAGHLDVMDRGPTRPAQLADLPACPRCDATLAPEALPDGRWFCPCCARVFTHGRPG